MSEGGELNRIANIVLRSPIPEGGELNRIANIV